MDKDTRMIAKISDEVATYRFFCTTEMEVIRAKTLFTKEAGTIEWLRSELGPNDIFYDIGANIGIYTIFAAMRKARVIAFEPHAVNASHLLENIRQNQVQDHVTVVMSALDNHDSLNWFNYKHITAGSSGSQLGHNNLESGGVFIPEVTCLQHSVLLNNLLSKIPAPTIVKIDVDGNELRVLNGMTECFKTIRTIQIEMHPSTSDSIISFLNSFGFCEISRHHTSLGKEAINQGINPDKVFFNVIFNKKKD